MVAPGIPRNSRLNLLDTSINLAYQSTIGLGGPRVPKWQQFETEFAAMVGTPHACAVSNRVAATITTKLSVTWAMPPDPYGVEVNLRARLCAPRSHACFPRLTASSN